MADITNTVTGASTFITNIIVWVSTKLANILSSIGFVEIFFFLMIAFGLYFWYHQHNLEPVRVRKF